MNRPALDGVVETCLYVSDVARSRDFYSRVFGFEAMGGDNRIVPLNVRQGQVLILFRRQGTLKPVPLAGSFIPPHDGSGEQHFAFGVPAESFKDWKSFLEGLNIEIESVVDWPQGGHSLYFRDPDRLLVELITPGVWKNY
jgi:catechol 2,3-dioxygenase-like lactoylglutathione lyase family enzyme